jgi:IclR family mhp operon transcriptional activator
MEERFMMGLVAGVSVTTQTTATQNRQQKREQFRSPERCIPQYGMAKWHEMQNRAHPEMIQGLQRGLQVMQTLQRCSIASLNDIHRATHISKPSLLRILRTLEYAGVVSRRLADGHYRLSAVARGGRKQDAHERVAEAAAPVLDSLCQKVKWPSDLLVPAGDYMERRETSRALSPLITHSPFHTPREIGTKVNWLLTGVGRAYLAFCPPRERERILERLRRSDKPVDLLARNPARLEQLLAETRKRGFGVRDPSFVGGPYGSPPIDDGLAGIAIPLQDGRRVYGSINILWIKTAFTIDEFAARHLADLQAAGQEIVAALKATSRRKGPEGSKR